MFMPTSFEYKSSLLLKEFTECASAMSFGKLFHGVAVPSQQNDKYDK